jgi:hypothetical protein
MYLGIIFWKRGFQERPPGLDFRKQTKTRLIIDLSSSTAENAPTILLFTCRRRH